MKCMTAKPRLEMNIVHRFPFKTKTDPISSGWFFFHTPIVINHPYSNILSIVSQSTTPFPSPILHQSPALMINPVKFYICTFY